MQQNNENMFFVDDELIERLLRGESSGPAASKPKRPAESDTLATATKLATAGKLDEAIKELEGAASRGESPAEVYSGLGHLWFEKQNWQKAAECYGKSLEANGKDAATQYNLGLVLERTNKYDDASAKFAEAAANNEKLWQ